jgi:hypothetical protein
MGKIAATVGNTLVYPGKYCLLSGVLPPVLGFPGGIFSPLDTFEVCFITAVETGIVI